MNRVIAAVDNSLAARSVLATSTELAKLLQAHVEALHVSDATGTTAESTAQALGVPFRRLTGDPLACICREAAAADVVAVAVGSRNQQHVRRAGHLVRQLADSIDKLLLVVPPGVLPTRGIHTIVIAIDAIPAKAKSLDAAIDLAVDTDVDLIVVHIDDENSVPSFSDQVAHETMAYIDEFVARYLHGAPKARLELRVGAPCEQIIDVAVAELADLLAFGWPRPMSRDRGAVARELLDRSPLPVLLIGTQEEEERT